MQLNKIVVSNSPHFKWPTPFLWYSKSNNLLVRILVTPLLSIMLFEASVFNVLIFIINLMVLDFMRMNFFCPFCVVFCACMYLHLGWVKGCQYQQCLLAILHLISQADHMQLK